MKIEGLKVHAWAVGDVAAELDAMLPAPLVEPIEFGIRGYREGATALVFSCTYLLRLAPR